jgi:hypothetical protein
MFKLLSKLLREKPKALDAYQLAGMERMSHRRRKTDEMAAPSTPPRRSEPVNEGGGGRKDLLSKARDLEIGTSFSGYTFRGKNQNERRMGSLIRDWHDRISHLPGFEVDPL